MSDSVDRVFTATAAAYDQDRARLIPGYAELYRWAVDLVPADSCHILDLGAGTGLLAAFLRARLPQAQLHLVDLSEAMLAKARARFAGEERVTFQTANYAVAPIEGTYDAVVSALSIHHLADDQKHEVFRRIFALLRPGGVFVNAEQVLGPTPLLEQRYKQLWLEQVRALGATEQQIGDSLLRQQEDRCSSVEDQLASMRQAGFVEVDCWYKSGRFATMAGVKPVSAPSA